MAVDMAAEVKGLAEFRRALRTMGPEWGRALSKVHRKIAKDVALKARSNAGGFGRQQARMAGAIKWSGVQTAARITVAQTARHPFANVAFWGQTKRTGWYGRLWAAGVRGKAQALPWVGSDWEVGTRGQGPYVINETIAAELPGVMETYEEELERLFYRAFPD